MYLVGAITTESEGILEIVSSMLNIVGALSLIENAAAGSYHYEMIGVNQCHSAAHCS